MKTEEIRDLIQIVEEAEIDELEISRWGQRVRITKHKNHASNNQPPQHITVSSPAQQPQSQPASAAGPSHTSASDDGVQGAESQVSQEEEDIREEFEPVKSPIVGTFYRASSPDSEPFVDVGDRVQPGQTLCIIEAMKIMNEIESEHTGVVKEVLVENAQPVEYNQTLFLIDPV